MRDSASAISCFCRCSSLRSSVSRLCCARSRSSPQAAEPLVDPTGGVGQGLGELEAGRTLALGQLAPPRLRDPSLLLREERERVRTHPRQPRLQLLAARGGLVGDERPKRLDRLRARGRRAAAWRETSATSASANASTGQRECDPLDHASAIVVLLCCAAMTLEEELERIAARSGADAVLAAEASPGDRLYLCAFEEADGGRTLAHARRRPASR